MALIGEMLLKIGLRVFNNRTIYSTVLNRCMHTWKELLKLILVLKPYPVLLLSQSTQTSMYTLLVKSPVNTGYKIRGSMFVVAKEE